MTPVIQAEAGLMSITGPATGPLTASGSPSPTSSQACSRCRAYCWRSSLGPDGARPARGRRDAGRHRRAANVPGVNLFHDGRTERRMGNRHPSIAPYDTFDAADGEFVLAVGHDAQFATALRARRPRPLARDPRASRPTPARVRHYDELRARAGWRVPLANARRLDRHADPGGSPGRVGA